MTPRRPDQACCAWAARAKRVRISNIRHFNDPETFWLLIGWLIGRWGSLSAWTLWWWRVYLDAAVSEHILSQTHKMLFGDDVHSLFQETDRIMDVYVVTAHYFPSCRSWRSLYCFFFLIHAGYRTIMQGGREGAAWTLWAFYRGVFITEEQGDGEKYCSGT